MISGSGDTRLFLVDAARPEVFPKDCDGSQSRDEEGGEESEQGSDLLALGTCLPAPVSEKKVLGDESSFTFWSVGVLFHVV
jgi:hypothetical protein